MKHRFAGLRSEEVSALQTKYGKNIVGKSKKTNVLIRLLRVLAEPMFLLLLGAAAVYFILGEPVDGAILTVFVVATIGIDFLQERRTDRTLDALRSLSAPRTRVRRDGADVTVDSAELVPGDVIELAEGDRIPADGVLLDAEALRVDESLLTGESQGVWKQVSADGAADRVYAGASVLHGSAVARVTAIGGATEYGKIGQSVGKAGRKYTPLQLQTRRLVKICTAAAIVFFALVCVFTYLSLPELATSERLTRSFLSGIALAMAMIPEEFPVILTVFLAMGAWRLAKKRALVRSLPAVETLGAVSVLCVDKTGTLTQNRMAVAEFFAEDVNALARIGGLACEQNVGDASETAILAFCAEHGYARSNDAPKKIYPFTPQTMTMANLWQEGDGGLIAAKGAPERLLAVCAMRGAERAEAVRRAEEMASKGLRVYAVARLDTNGDETPDTYTDRPLAFVGLMGLSDPPKPDVADALGQCRAAKVRPVMITGDGAATARAVAKALGMPHRRIVSGAELAALPASELHRRVARADIFCRVAPDQKLLIVRTLQENGETVAMTGDGVNDAPALRQADIGVAMGKRGSDISREAADLVLLDDNFAVIPQTIRDARRIYANIRRAVAYVIAVHVPVALITLLAPLCGMTGQALPLLPVHLVWMELLIDPTCSVVLERIPAERGAKDQPPRNPRESLVTRARLVGSLAQGLALFAVAFGAYAFSLPRLGVPTARAVLIAILTWGNFWLIAVNASAEPLTVALREIMRDRLLRFVCPLALLLPLLVLYTPLSALLRLAPLSAPVCLAAFALAAVAVVWYEIVKAVIRRRNAKRPAA